VSEATSRDYWAGRSAFALAVLVGGGWAAALIIAALHPMPTSSEGLNFLNNVGQTLATGLIAFLGYKVGEQVATTRGPDGRDYYAPPPTASPTTSTPSAETRATAKGAPP
jgi:hypothetical protein